MKILHLDPDDLDSPFAGGQARRTFEINRRLVKMGHEVTVITTNYPGSKSQIREGINYTQIGSKKFLFNLISYFFLIPFIIKKHKFDLLIEDNISPFTFCLTPLFTKKPVISIIQSFFAKQSSRRYHLPFWIIEKYAARLYKNFIVLTENMKEKIHRLNPKAEIIIIPNGLNIIPAMHPAHQNYLLFLGRIDYHEKGLDLLIPIMKVLQTKLPKLKLIIAGDGRDTEKLKQILNKENLPNVEYIGKVAGSQKEELLKDCFALAHPSRFENFPLTILETASYGKPTISFEIENLKEIINNNQIGLTAPAFNINEYIKQILSLFNNPVLYRQFSQNAHNWAKKHTWDKISEEQEKFYLSCIKNK